MSNDSARPTAFALSALLIFCASSAPAQDWDILQDARTKTTVALIEFDSGIRIGARCTNGDYEVLITGLPPVPRDRTERMLRIADGDEPLTDTTWTMGSTRDAAFSRLPAPFARRMAVGGRLQIGVPGERGGRETRYVMELAPSSAAVEQTLIACGRRLVDRRDSLMGQNAPEGLAQPTTGPRFVWARAPRPEFPSGGPRGQASRGVVTISCVARVEGSLTDCVIESEHPRGFGFGRAALSAALRSRMGGADGRSLPTDDGLIVYTTSFIME